MSADQLGAFLAAARQPKHRRLYPFFLVLARAGLRPGEAFGLQWDDVDLAERTLLIERSFSRGEVGTTKTGETRRVDMSQQLARVFRRLEVERAEEKLRRGVKTLPPWVFSSEAGTPLDLYNATRVFKRVLKAAELPNFRLYDLRHTFATQLLERGAPITYVAAQLGHAKPTTTLQWYAHWLPTNRRNYVDALDAGEKLSEVIAEVADAAPRASVPLRHGTNWAPFPQLSKSPAMEMWKKVGSPGRARTCDFLINSQALYRLSYRGVFGRDPSIPAL
jgi:integrase